MVPKYRGLFIMKHSIITWDSSFRNFFHLLTSLADLDYNLDQVEVIFIEQRTQKIADSIAESIDVLPVREVATTLKNRLFIKLIYLNESDEEPYHPGRLLNIGLKMAKGDFLSTMDADILVPSNFLKVLDMVHERGDRIACMHRYHAPFPCGTTFENWTRQIIDYDLILNICPQNKFIPQVVNNKAPLLSTRRSFWEEIEFYEDHRIFSTAYTLFGRDISARFKLLLGDMETPLPIACVHPWHPTELDRGKDKIQILYQAQSFLMNWSKEQNVYAVNKRKPISDQLYRENKQAIDNAIKYSEINMIQGARRHMTSKPI